VFSAVKKICVLIFSEKRNFQHGVQTKEIFWREKKQMTSHECFMGPIVFAFRTATFGKYFL
jgi:hypothetical protein